MDTFTTFVVGVDNRIRRLRPIVGGPSAVCSLWGRMTTAEDQPTVSDHCAASAGAGGAVAEPTLSQEAVDFALRQKVNEFDGRRDMSNWKKAIKARALEEEVWDEFLEAKNDLRKLGVETWRAWTQTAVEFGWSDLIPAMHAKRVDRATKEKIEAHKQDGVFGEMAKRAYAGSTDIRETIFWIFENIGKQPHEWDENKIPNGGAIEWIKEIQNNNKARQTFYEQVLIKLLPSKAQMDAEDRKQDDGRKTLQLIDRLKHISENARRAMQEEAA